VQLLVADLRRLRPLLVHLICTLLACHPLQVVDPVPHALEHVGVLVHQLQLQAELVTQSHRFVALVRLEQILVRVGYVEPGGHFRQVDIHEVELLGVHLDLGDTPCFFVIPVLCPDALSSWDEL